MLELRDWLLEPSKEALAHHGLARKKQQGRLSTIEKEKIRTHAARLDAPFGANLILARCAAQRMEWTELDLCLGRLTDLWSPVPPSTLDRVCCQKGNRLRGNHILNGLPTPGTHHLKQWMETLANCNPLGFVCAQIGQAFVLTWITQFDSQDPIYLEELPRNLELQFERNRAEWMAFDQDLRSLGEKWNSAELKRVINYQFSQFGVSWSELLDEADPGIPRIP
jgi:hypothetical protein